MLTGNFCLAKATAIARMVDDSGNLLIQAAFHMILSFLRIDGVYRTATATGPAMDAVFVDFGIRPIIRFQGRCHDHAGKAACHTAFGDQPLGKTEGTETADKCRMSFRPAAAKGLPSDLRITFDPLSRCKLLKTGINTRAASLEALLPKPGTQGLRIGIDESLSFDSCIDPQPGGLRAEDPHPPCGQQTQLEQS